MEAVSTFLHKGMFRGNTQSSLIGLLHESNGDFGDQRPRSISVAHRPVPSKCEDMNGKDVLHGM
jgi:hypothetical protein